MADMIYNFVLSEVEKHNAKSEIHDQQQSYMKNAHAAVYKEILDLPSVESSQVTDEEVYIRNENMQTMDVNDDTVTVDKLIRVSFL